MRYRDLLEARPWRKYSGEEWCCFLQCIDSIGSAHAFTDARAQFGSVTTGKQSVWVGYFVQVIDSQGHEWLAEDPYSLRRALRSVEAKLNEVGRSLQAIGLNREWQESGLSANTGWGYHPDFDGAVHMFDRQPRDFSPKSLL